ncbi:MAG: glycosyltransferase family 9 protein [Armatimonadetes bacterium]|nr:glycosyltransferase family 9 protein [Armatimonadota bacterium]
MKINLMRQLDWWFGRPTCFLLSLLYDLTGCLRKRKSPVENPKKILFIKLFGLGSIVLTYPAIRAVKETYPSAEIYFLTFEENREICRLLDLASNRNIVTVRAGGIAVLLKEALGAFFLLRKAGVDVVVDFEFFSKMTAIFSLLICRKHRVGFSNRDIPGLRRASFIVHPVPYNHTLHISRSFFTLVESLGIRSDCYHFEVPLISNQDTRTIVLDKLQDAAGFEPAAQKLVLLNCNAGDLISQRKWPLTHFAALAEKVLEAFPNALILFTGAKSERETTERAVRLVPNHGDRVRNIAGWFTIGELVELLSLASVFVTNDSGPAHIAALTPIRTIILFGPETPELYRPISERARCFYADTDCQPCVTVYNGKVSSCKDNTCLQAITPEEVFGEVARALQGEGAQPLGVH